MHCVHFILHPIPKAMHFSDSFFKQFPLGLAQFVDAILHLYGWFVTHMYSVFFLPRTHVEAMSADTKDVYPVCIALHMHIMPYGRLVFVELHIHN